MVGGLTAQRVQSVVVPDLDSSYSAMRRLPMHYAAKGGNTQAAFKMNSMATMGGDSSGLFATPDSKGVLPLHVAA